MKAYKITGKLGDICSFVGGNEVKKGDMVYLHSESDMSIEAMKQALEDVRFAREALAGSYLRSCDGHLRALVQVLTQAIEQAEKQGSVAWAVFNKHGRIYFAIGNQSFPIEYTPEDEPDCSAGQAAEWYMDQLRHALTRLATPQPQRKWVGTVDCIGLALDLEAQAKRVESQTVERAMLAAANGLRIIDKESKA
jgi:hypothetical protein